MASNSNIFEIQRYIFHSQDRLFLDTNIWLSIYGPVAYTDWRSKIYSTALRDIRANSSQIYLDVVVVSEFINNFARFEYNQLKNKPTFKEFRKSPEFKPIAKEIAANVRRIHKTSNQCDSCFESLDLNNVLADFESGQVDFNDQVITNICRKHELILVTHDYDFIDNNLRILTANRKMF